MRRFQLIKQMTLAEMAAYLEKELAAALVDFDFEEWLSELIEDVRGMSGIYIPGMGMPKSCCYCPCVSYDEPVNENPDSGRMWCHAVGREEDNLIGVHLTEKDILGMTDKIKIPVWCPLIPVPDRVRLIEKGATLDACYTHYEDYMNGKIDGKTALLNIEKEIKAAPTIIEA